MVFASMSALPQTWRCNGCGRELPVALMQVYFCRRRRAVMLTRRCKPCGYKAAKLQRTWSRAYLREWRRRNRALTADYARQRYRRLAPRLVALARVRYRRDRPARLIQGRLLRRFGEHRTLAECRALLRRFGPAYPMPAGLTAEGRRAARRIVDRTKKAGCPVPMKDALRMIWDDRTRGHIVPKHLQPKTVAPGRARAQRARWARFREEQMAC